MKTPFQTVKVLPDRYSQYRRNDRYSFGKSFWMCRFCDHESPTRGVRPAGSAAHQGDGAVKN
ncbi:MAG: hypothetical protein ACKV2Q_27555 [Planctomycetaceae bacterium]